MTKTRRNDEEFRIQSEFYSLIKYYSKTYPLLELTFAIPNGGKRSHFEGVKLKAEGVLAGIPDICIPIPNGDHGALFLEFKTPKGRLSDKQKTIIPLLREAYNKVEVVRSPKEALSVVAEYLDLNLPYFDIKSGAEYIIL